MPVLLNLLPADLSILPGTSTEHGVLGKTDAELRTRALAQKPGRDHDFLGKFGAEPVRT